MWQEMKADDRWTKTKHIKARWERTTAERKQNTQKQNGSGRPLNENKTYESTMEAEDRWTEMNQTTKSQRKTADTHKAEDRYTYTKQKTLHMNTTPQKPPSTTSLTHTIPKTAPNHYNCMLHLFFFITSSKHRSELSRRSASYCFRPKFQLASSAINLRSFPGCFSCCHLGTAWNRIFLIVWHYVLTNFL